MNHDTSLTKADISRIIEMAWEDRTPFEAIKTLYGLGEPDVRVLMRRELKPASFRLWRERVSGRTIYSCARLRLIAATARRNTNANSTLDAASSAAVFPNNALQFRKTF
jgi:uncharacterized protein (TIGR03643 family)